MTPEDLEGYARALRATADAVDAMAASMRAQQAAAARLGMLAPRLTVQRESVSSEPMRMHSEQRRAISTKLLPEGDPNMDAARAVGIPSLRQLAKRLGFTVSMLSQVRGKSRPMPPDAAAKFKRITGKDWQ